MQRRKPLHHDLIPKRKDAISWWRHPAHRSIRVPQKVAAALAIMSMGVVDYDVIAAAVGLTDDEVKRIDMAEDRVVRELGLAGIPHGEYFRLHEKVRCPRCDGWVTIAPCVACDIRQQSA